MAADQIDSMLENIGRIILEDSGYPSSAILLYAELARNMVSPSIFIEEGNSIKYQGGSENLMYPLLDLWEEWEPNKRWKEMEYLLQDGNFHVTFNYSDEIDPEEDEFERRDRIVRRHLGDKPIVYPPWPDGDQVFDL